MRHLILTAALVLATALPALAETPNPIQRNNLDTIWFENWIGLENAMLRVATPDGEVTDVVAKNGTPVFQLSGAAANGVYRYELRAATDEMVKNRDYTGSALEGGGEEFIPKQYYTTGFFVVKGGVILNPSDMTEEQEQ